MEEEGGRNQCNTQQYSGAACKICGRSNYSASNNKKPSQNLFFDSRATKHVTHDPNNLSLSQPYQGTDSVVVGNGNQLQIQHMEDAKKLAEELEGWIRSSGLVGSPEVRGVIAPHAGYSYSGPAAAYAFANIDPSNTSRVFLLGPSHHYYTPKCALSRATIYKTPIGDLPIDLEVNEELKATGKFDLMDLQVDEAEHSMEMHLPYLAKVFSGYPVKIVPILVGAVSAENEAMYGKLLAKYVDDPKNFFSVSSDFCHWGSRFNYMHYDKKHGSINKSIEALDKMGMDIIETGDPDAFKKYLSETDNTICGRHPISVFLHMVGNCSTKIKIKFLRYEQSSQCKSMRDSSVSYASAAAKVDA